jgi:hypothetical protein
MSKIKVFVLTVDSESWLGSEIHPTHEAALQSLINDSEWVEGVEQGMDEEEVREWLGEENIFFCIEEKVIDTEGFQE